MGSSVWLVPPSASVTYTKNDEYWGCHNHSNFHVAGTDLLIKYLFKQNRSKHKSPQAGNPHDHYIK